MDFLKELISQLEKWLLTLLAKKQGLGVGCDPDDPECKSLCLLQKILESAKEAACLHKSLCCKEECKK